MDYLYMTEIKMDEEKILRERKYKLQGVYDAIRSRYAKYDIHEVKGREGYITFASSKRDEYELSKFAATEFGLLDDGWFASNVKEMIWHDWLSGEESVEDILKVHKERGLL